jgi:hypothetical protein
MRNELRGNVGTLGNVAKLWQPSRNLAAFKAATTSVYRERGLYIGRVPRMPRMPRMPCRKLASLISKDATARRIQEKEAREPKEPS